MEAFIILVFAAYSYLVAASFVESKKDDIAYLNKKIELINERILILREMGMDDKMENFIITSIDKLKDDVTALKVEIGKIKVYVALMSGTAAFVASFLKDIVMAIFQHS